MRSDLHLPRTTEGRPVLHAEPLPPVNYRSEAFAEDLDPPPAALQPARRWSPGSPAPTLFAAAIAVGAVLTGLVNVLFAQPV